MNQTPPQDARLMGGYHYRYDPLCHLFRQQCVDGRWKIVDINHRLKRARLEKLFATKR